VSPLALGDQVKIKPVITALRVSPFPATMSRWGRSFQALDGWLNAAYDCAEALAFMRQTSTPVVICECDLRDGNWKDCPSGLRWDA